MFHIIKYQARREKIRNAWIRAIARPVLPKAVHVSSDHFTEDSFDESQELKRRLGGNLQYIYKPDAVTPLFPNGKAINKSVLSNIEKTIKLRTVKVSLFNIRMEKNAKRRLFIPQYLE